jgi:hypothetical protein
MDLPHSPACDRNKDAIATALKEWISPESKNFLEIGFGTGQHAYHFAGLFPNLNYYAADQKNYHPILKLRMETLTPPKNLRGPFLFYANEDRACVDHDLILQNYDIVFSANTLHIMSWSEALLSLECMGQLLRPQGTLLLYGPFKFSGQFTSESNALFHQSLKQRDSRMGIRSYEEIKKVLIKQGLSEKKILTMPANNNILAFQKT